MRWFQQPRPWILAASLAANLFFVGLIGATLAFGPPGRDGPPPVRFLMKGAGPETKPAFEQALKAHESEMRAAGEAMHAAKQDFRSALTAETVDPAALRQAIEARRTAWNNMGRAMDEAFIEVAPTLPLETRREMAERKRWRKRDRKKDD